MKQQSKIEKKQKNTAPTISQISLKKLQTKHKKYNTNRQINKTKTKHTKK